MTELLIEIGARIRYEQIRAEPGMRDHWPPWDGASDAVKETYRKVVSEWLAVVREAERMSDELVA